MSRISKVLMILLGILIVGTVIWYFKNTEEVAKDKFVGFQGEAKSNPYLALQRLSENRDISVEAKVNILSWGEPSYDEVLFVPMEYIPNDPALFSNLESWLEDGGTLVSGSSKTQSYSNEVSLSAMHRKLFGIKKLDPTNNKTTVGRYGDYELKIPQAYNFELEGHQTIVCSKEGDFLFGEKKVGAGRVLLFNSLRAFDNSYLTKEDNAAFLMSILIDSEVLVLATRPEYMGVWSWIKRKALWSLILIVSCVITWVMMVSRRFGPIRLDQSQSSRKLMEHIKVSGEYQWGVKQGPQLLNELRLGVDEMLKLRHPQLKGRSPEQQNLYLGSLTKLSAEEVHSAFHSEGKTPEQFYKSIIVLKKIKEVL